MSARRRVLVESMMSNQWMESAIFSVGRGWPDICKKYYLCKLIYIAKIVQKLMKTKSEVGVIADAMLEKKAQDVVSLDLTKIGTAIADHFVICNADSTTQVVAISDNVEEMMEKEYGRSVLRKQGRENAFWIILDYSDIVVHIFKTDQRLFYRLEDLWADAVKTTYTDSKD